jgi:hypothetical protein
MLGGQLPARPNASHTAPLPFRPLIEAPDLPPGFSGGAKGGEGFAARWFEPNFVLLFHP